MRVQKTPDKNGNQKITPRPAIDIDILEQLRGMLGRDTPQMMAGLIENYLENTPRLLENLRQSIEQEQGQEQVELACTLKSNSITFGAIRLCALCEELATSKSPDNPIAKLNQIESEFERVRLVLEAEWHRLYEIRLKTDVFFPTGSYKNIGFYPQSPKR